MSSQSSQVNEAIRSKRLQFFVVVLLMPSVMNAAGHYSSAGEAFFAGAMQILLLYAIYAIYKFFKKNNNKEQ